jgi:hypothetical protein|tara:strand:+ start:377 stop:523 length:147 start_codon:yes stop_codon:yes gene_type:complete
MFNKVKQLISQFERTKETIAKFALIKPIEDELKKIKRELANQLQKENK